MNSTLQADLRARASAYASDWQPDVSADAEVATVLTQVTRRRRGRGALATASAVVLAAAVAGAYATLGDGAQVAPGVADAPVGSSSALAILGTLGPNDAVLSVRSLDDSSGAQDLAIVHGNASAVERITPADVRDALGRAADGWPSISLVALQPDVSRAGFLLEDPAKPDDPRLAAYDWVTGSVTVGDPCEASFLRAMNHLNADVWCPIGKGKPESAVEERSKKTRPQDNFVRCLGSTVRRDTTLSLECKTPEEGRYLYLHDLETVKESVIDLGPGLLEQPWVVDSVILANRTTTEGDAVLVTSDDNQVDVGGAPVTGLGKVDGRMLVATSSDRFSAPSTYGRVLGLWAPGSGAFEEMPQLPLGADDVVSRIPSFRGN